MKQETIARILKIFSVLSFFVGSLFMLWYFPLGIHEIFIEYPQFIKLEIPTMVGSILVTCLCYVALFHFYKMCNQIESGNSFTRENAQHMKIIGYIALSLCLLGIISLLFLFIVKCLSGPLVVIGFFVEFILSGISVICLALSALIKNAAIIKEENDLTI